MDRSLITTISLTLTLALTGSAPKCAAMDSMPGMDKIRGAASADPRVPGADFPTPGNSALPPLSLPELQKMALDHNPTLIQAQAQVDGEKGAARQAGIWPNPMAGYTGDLMGLPRNGAGEWQGGSVNQDIILGGKLRLSRAKYAARADAAEQQRQAQALKVSNDVQTHFYRTLASLERLKMHNELLKSMRDRWLTVNEMINMGEANQADKFLAAARQIQKSPIHR